jgi:negative regulator of sigma E activity
MLELTDAIRNEVLEPITFVLAYPTVYTCVRVCVCACVCLGLYVGVQNINTSSWRPDMS